MEARSQFVAFALAIFLLASSGLAQQARPKYSIEEYNDYTAAINEQEPQARLRALEAFLQEYPESTLRPFVHQTYMQTASGLNRWGKVVEHAGKFLDLDRAQVLEVYQQTPGVTEEQVDGLYYQTLLSHAYGFLLSFRDGGAKADAEADKAARRARQGLEHLEKLRRPENTPPAQFEELKRQQAGIFHNVLGYVAFRKKDYDTAAGEYVVVVEQNPEDAVSNYRLGVSCLQARQAKPLRGLWAVGRAVALFPEAQKKGVRDYLVKNMAVYAGVLPACVEKQVKSLIAQARQAVSPPPDWALPSAEQVSALRTDLTVKRIFDELKAGGEQTQLVWFASCGMELPELPGKVLEVNQEDVSLVTLRMAVGEEAAAADIVNLEAKVKEPPEVKNLKPGDIVRVSGVLTDWQPQPFLLQLSEGRVNPEDIPKARTPAPRRRRPSSR